MNNSAWSTILAELKKLGLDGKSKMRGPATAAAVSELERITNTTLPDDFKAMLLEHDGSDHDFEILAGLPLMSVEDIQLAWLTWDAIAADADENAEISQDFSAVPSDGVEPLYANSRWIPFAGDSQNFVALDFDPGPAGTVGQVINAGRDDEVRYVVSKSFSEFLALVADQYTRGRVVLKKGPGNSVYPRMFIAGNDRDFLQALPFTLKLKPEK